MKVLFVALSLVAGAFARSAVQQNGVFIEGPKCPPPDPITRADPLPINVTLAPLIRLDHGSEVSNIIAEGQSSLHFKIDVNVVLLSATFEVTVGRISGNATYNAIGNIDASPISEETIPRGDIEGSGIGKIASEGLHVKGRAALFINVIGNKVNVRTLTLETVSFDALSIDLGEDITIGGKTVDWDDLSANIKENFDREFAQHKAELTEIIRGIANGIVGQFTLAELLKLLDLIGQGGDC